jgi:hypothetical protein
MITLITFVCIAATTLNESNVANGNQRNDN